MGEMPGSATRRETDLDDRTWARGATRQSAIVQVLVRLGALGLLLAVIAAAAWLTGQS